MDNLELQTLIGDMQRLRESLRVQGDLQALGHQAGLIIGDNILQGVSVKLRKYQNALSGISTLYHNFILSNSGLETAIRIANQALEDK